MDSTTPLIETVIEQAADGGLGFPDFERFAIAISATAPKAMDKVALEIADQYMREKINFEKAGNAMNMLFSLMISGKFLDANDNAIPEVAYAVYCAFDAGEYYHQSDAPEVDPEEKYTRPQIAEVLKKYFAST